MLKNFFCLFTFILCSLSCLAQMSFTTKTFDGSNVRSLENLQQSEDGQTILSEYPFLKEYQKQEISKAKQRNIRRWPNIGLSYDDNSEEKSRYVPNQPDGWKISGLDYVIGIYGKHYRKDKTKKGNRHVEQRLYKIEKMKGVDNHQFDFDTHHWLKDVYNIREVQHGAAENVGYALLFEDQENEKRKRICFFDDNMNLIQEHAFDSRQKHFSAFDILQSGNQFCVINSSMSGLFQKDDGGNQYELTTFDEKGIRKVGFDLDNQYASSKGMRVDQIIGLDNGHKLLIGHLLYVDLNQEDNPIKDANVFYMQVDQEGNVIDPTIIPVKTQVQPKLFYTFEDEEFFSIGVENATQNMQDLVLVVNKKTQEIFSYYSDFDASQQYIQNDLSNGKLHYCALNPQENAIHVTTISVK